MKKPPHNPGMSDKAWEKLHEFIARVLPVVERREAEKQASKKGA
ncbi:hypothetical protein [Paenibacillus lutrae]|nr:hypothetical protein [Paenibacillus lutrae]